MELIEGNLCGMRLWFAHFWSCQKLTKQPPVQVERVMYDKTYVRNGKDGVSIRLEFSKNAMAEILETICCCGDGGMT